MRRRNGEEKNQKQEDQEGEERGGGGAAGVGDSRGVKVGSSKRCNGEWVYEQQ